jgi:hypothetical protein
MGRVSSPGPRSGASGAIADPPASDAAAIGAATRADSFINALGGKAFHRAPDAEGFTSYTTSFLAEC